MRRTLLENLDNKIQGKISFRRYSLSEIISESYKTYYESEDDSNFKKLVEAHISEVRSNPADTERLSRQLCSIKHIASLLESKKMKDEDLLVPKEKYAEVNPKEEKIGESNKSRTRGAWQNPHRVNKSQDIGESREDEDFLEDTELTEEEVAELTDYLKKIRNKEVNECDTPEDVTESSDQGRKLVPERKPVTNSIIKTVKESSIKARKLGRKPSAGKVRESSESDIEIHESKTWSDVSLKEFAEKSVSKAFTKTFKKLDKKLHEGTALTRQESVNLYKAANSAMTQLSVELEHNPEFLSTFKESTTLLSVDVAALLESLKNGKAPSKATMKSLAKFSEALLLEDDEEDLPSIEDEEEEIISGEEEIESESEEFEQEYADARVELHMELADEYAESEDPEVQERLAQDAEEVIDLPGVTEEQVAEIAGELPDTEESGEAPEDEESPEEATDSEADDITDDELSELKKHLMEMRKARKFTEALSPSWENIMKGFKDDGYTVNSVDNKNNLIKLSKNGKEYVCKYREDSKYHYIAGDPELVK